mmetsp:Transcript_64528/g.144161  ORF Transcript_64528/g.144161 Transcript_64528/m.144161 type:complete len:87 (-) Transcript_64528:439-699(-)
MPLLLKLLTIALYEYAWSFGLDKVIGSSTPLSSLSLQLAHALTLIAIYQSHSPATLPAVTPPTPSAILAPASKASHGAACRTTKVD